MEGTHISLVRDYSDYADIEYVSICDFVIFGDPAPLHVEQREVSVKVDETLSITIPHIELGKSESQQIMLELKQGTVQDGINVSIQNDIKSSTVSVLVTDDKLARIEKSF